MIFICYGMQKSASSFAWSIVKDLTEELGHNQNLLRKTYIDDKNFRVEYQNIFNIEEYEYFNERIPQNEILVIKSHAPISAELGEHIQSQGGCAIATYRDPLDIAISLLDVGVTERLKPIEKQRTGFASIKCLDDAVQRLPKTVEIAESWLNFDFITHIHYEQLCYNTNTAVDNIVSSFKSVGVEVPDEIVVDVLTRYSSKSNPVIPEFNVGGVGRYNERMSSTDINALKSKYSSFRNKIESLI
ncbi:hypothetical protein [Shewanella goraebulensis]|uniref:hypothetical protein n=1 Tax=Shewanella goraebulensis TaxID=3050637 RepID=UPI00254B6C2C|nr:hypothetical protein [Shewanella goraebulensis]